MNAEFLDEGDEVRLHRGSNGHPVKLPPSAQKTPRRLIVALVVVFTLLMAIAIYDWRVGP
jgi:hypothetical protein